LMLDLEQERGATAYLTSAFSQARRTKQDFLFRTQLNFPRSLQQLVDFTRRNYTESAETALEYWRKPASARGLFLFIDL